MRLFAAGVLTALVLAAVPATALAAFTVTTTADTYDATCDAQCSLRDAVSAANAAAGDDVITLPAGTYRLTRLGAQENANVTGDLDVTSVITVEGAGAGTTVIDAVGADRVIEAASGALTMRDVTVTGGALRITGPGCAPSDFEGAGIASRVDLVLQRVRVTGNRYSGTSCSSNRGGGVNLGGGGTHTLTVTGSEISDNYASDGGGGIQFYGTTLTIRDSSITANSTDNTAGGLGADADAVTIVNTTISDNSAQSSGGIGLSGVTGAQIASSTITGNLARTGEGGGIGRLSSSSTVTLRNTVLAANTSLAGGDDCGSTANITYSSAGYVLAGPACPIVGGTGNVITADPGLGPPAALGGLGLGREPLAGGAARNAGDPAGCADVPAGQLTSDQRGAARVQEGRCDIGAIEATPAAAPPGVPQPPAATTFALNTRAPKLKGTVRAGRTIRCGDGAWTDAGARRVSWLANGKTVKGATKRTLKVSKRLVGRALQCRETVTDGGRRLIADSAPVIVRRALKVRAKRR